MVMKKILMPLLIFSYGIFMFFSPFNFIVVQSVNKNKLARVRLVYSFTVYFKQDDSYQDLFVLEFSGVHEAAQCFCTVTGLQIIQQILYHVEGYIKKYFDKTRNPPANWWAIKEAFQNERKLPLAVIWRICGWASKRVKMCV